MHREKDSIFTTWCWENWTSTCRRLELDPYPSVCSKIKSKLMKDLDIRLDTLKPLEENVEKTLENVASAKTA